MEGSWARRVAASWAGVWRGEGNEGGAAVSGRRGEAFTGSFLRLEEDDGGSRLMLAELDLVSVFWRGVVVSIFLNIFFVLLSLGDLGEGVSCRRSRSFLKGRLGLLAVDGVLLLDRGLDCVLLPRRWRYVVGDCELFLRRALVAGLT